MIMERESCLVKALVYEKNNKVEAYIPVEQLYEALYDKDLPTYTLDF